VLVYRPTQDVQLAWFDRSGKRLALLGSPFGEAGGGHLSLSPDGLQAAVTATTAENMDILLLDSRGIRTRFTADPALDGYATWSPDAARIAFFSRRKGHLDLYERKVSDPIGSEAMLLADGTDKFPTSWSPDGRFLLYTFRSTTTASDLWVLPLGSDRKPFPFRQTPFSEGNAMFSPDGRWVAYASDEPGRNEVFVAPFPGPGTAHRISTAGGATPQWRRDGKELFYVAPERKIMSAAMTLGTTEVSVGAVKPLFDLPPSAAALLTYSWGVTPDGQRLLIKVPADERAASLSLVVNWPALVGATGR
jgi:eukaryotic-like serine/threonine-protein kinase